MNIPDNFDLYFENKLSDEKKREFEKDIREKPELHELFNAYLQINQIIESELDSPILNATNDPILDDLTAFQRLAIEEDVLRFQRSLSNSPDEDQLISNGISLDAKSCETLQKIMAEEKKESEFLAIIKGVAERKTSKGKNLFFIYLGIAAAVLIAFFTGEFLLRENNSIAKNMNPIEAYTKYYRPENDDELKTIISKDKNTPSDFYDYKRSGTPDTFLPESAPDPIKLTDYDLSISLLFQGIIELERSNPTEALKCFSNILALEKPGKTNSVKFYMSLAYLSENNPGKAVPILKELSLTKNPYRKSARKILRSL